MCKCVEAVNQDVANDNPRPKRLEPIGTLNAETRTGADYERVVGGQTWNQGVAM